MATQDWPTDWEILQDDQVDGIPQMQYHLPDEDASEEGEPKQEGEDEESEE